MRFNAVFDRRPSIQDKTSAKCDIKRGGGGLPSVTLRGGGKEGLRLMSLCIHVHDV